MKVTLKIAMQVTMVNEQLWIWATADLNDDDDVKATSIPATLEHFWITQTVPKADGDD